MTMFAFCSSGRDGKKIGWLTGIFLLVGIVCLTVAGFGVPGKVIYQGAFVLCVLIAFYYWIRYLLLSYVYEVRKEDDRYLLYVIQKQGSRRNTLVALPLDGVREIRRCLPKEKPPRTNFTRELRYTTALFSPTLALFADTADGVTLLRLEDDEAFGRQLCALHHTLTIGTTCDPGEKRADPAEGSEETE